MAIDLTRFQQQFARAGITQSAVRLGKSNKGVTGMRATARKFCANLMLEQIPSPADYIDTLDEWTEELRQVFPAVRPFWGVPRKCLNIFMREASYNTHLCNAYSRLRSLEEVLEVPLDSYVAAGLLQEPGAVGQGLHWDAIIRLTPEDSQRFQDWALTVAQQKGTSRVHLDVVYFPFP